MSHTLLAFAALGSVAMYSIHTHKSSQQQNLNAHRTEVEAHAETLGGDLLDRAAALPFSGAGTETGVALLDAQSLDQWDGKSDTVAAPVGADTLWYTVRAAVAAVEQSGGQFVAGDDSAPFRRVTLTIEGALSTSASVERVYADLSQ